MTPKMTVRRRACAALLSLAAALAAPAHAQPLTNPGFEDALAGWTTAGDAGVLPGGTQGAAMLWLTTASLDVDDFPRAAGELNRSGTPALVVGQTGGLEDVLGVPLGALDPDLANGVAAYEGSAAVQLLVAQAGDRLGFDWDYGSSDDTGGDYAFAVVDGGVLRLADIASATQPGTLGNTWRSGFARGEIVFATSGVHRVGFGVVDVGDFTVTSTLAVDNLALSPVPEPAGAVLALAALLTLGAWRGARQRRR